MNADRGLAGVPLTAVIGGGRIGRIHLAAYRTMARPLRLACVEPSEAARRDVALDAPGLALFSDLDALLAVWRPTLAVVCTPARTHRAVVERLALAGIPVLCEKPLAVTDLDASAMVEACRDAGVPLFYGASYLHLPAVQAALEAVRDGLIGDVRLMREQIVGGSGPEARDDLGANHYPAGGPGGSGLGLMDHGVHLVDLFRRFADRPVSRVVGRGNRSGSPASPEHLTIEFEGGAIGSLVYEDGTFPTALPAEGGFSHGEGWTAAGPSAKGEWLADPGRIDVHGTRGALRIHHYANALYHFDGQGVRQVELAGRPAPGHFATQLETVLDELDAGTPPSCPGEDGLEALRILEAAYLEPPQRP